MKTITINFPGASLNDMRVQNKNLFYYQNWHTNEAFANEVIPAGKWEVRLEPCTGSLNKTWDEQQATLPDLMYEVPPAAVLVYAMVEHFRKTGERAFEKVWVRTSSCDSDGTRVSVGDFGAKGVSVSSHWGDGRSSDIGLAGARKLSVEAGELEAVEGLNLPTDKKVAVVEKYLREDSKTTEGGDIVFPNQDSMTLAMNIVKALDNV